MSRLSLDCLQVWINPNRDSVADAAQRSFIPRLTQNGQRGMNRGGS